MNANEYLEKSVEICNSVEYCNQCPLQGCGAIFPCQVGNKIEPALNSMKNAVEIVEEWTTEHPVKTRQFKTKILELLEMFPKASAIAILNICPARFDTTLVCRCIEGSGFCADCKKEYWLTEEEDGRS